jgi:hypothetical protein
MADLYSILQDPNYTGANLETKKLIFDKYSSQTPDYTGANPETQALIRTKYGIEPAPEKGPIASTVDYVGGLSRNLVPQIFGGINAAIHPFRTFNEMVTLGAGGLQKLSPKVLTDMVNQFEMNPEAAQGAVDQANAVGGEYAKNYGSIEAFLAHLKAKPLSVLGDFSAGLGAFGKLGKATPGLEATGSTLSNLSNLTNPVAPAVNAVTGTANLGVRGYNTARGYTDRVLDSKGNALRTAVKGKGEEILNALRGNTELVPGSLPTAGEAAAAVGSTGYAKLQKDAAKTLADDYLARDIANAKARDASLGEIGGTEADLAAAIAERDAKASATYGLSDNQIVAADKTFTSLMSRPDMKKAVADAAELAAKKGQSFGSGANTAAKQVGTDPITGKPIMSEPSFANYTGQDLHNIKLAFDDLINTPVIKEGGLSGNTKKATIATKDAFLKWVEQDNNIPAYKTAREQYAADSKPINEMEVGQHLRKELKSSLQNETPGSFTAAVENEAGTIETATKSDRYKKLTDVLSDANVAKVEAVKQDFLRQEQNKQNAKRGETVELAPNVRTSGVLSRVATLADKLLRAIEGKISRATAIEIAKEMLHPELAASSLEKAMSKRFSTGKLSTTERIPMGLIKRRVPPAIILNNLAPANQNNLGASE